MSQTVHPQARSPSEGQDSHDVHPWKVAIIDDEPSVHQVTSLVLRRFTFDGRPIEFVSAYSAEEAKRVLQEHRDVAVALVDVVMEEDDSGLTLIRWVREELGNAVIRLVVRTGQPAMAPEEVVIQRYEVNDYRLKTELTDTRLRTTLSTALRNYRDLVTVERSRHALERMVDGATSSWRATDLDSFVRSVLDNATGLLLSEDGELRSCNALAVRKGLQEYEVIGGTGPYSELAGQRAQDILSSEAWTACEEALKADSAAFRGTWFAAPLPISSSERSVLVLGYPDELQPIEHQVLSAYTTTVRLAADNHYLSRRVERAQRDMLFFLGEVVERRSESTGNHVRRVSRLVQLMTRSIYDDVSIAEEWGLASSLHDVGKAAIPDAILHKPGALTEEEYDLIRTHTTIGHELLTRSDDAFFRVASDIALSHHERWDGNGYPHLVSGDTIPHPARLTAIADVFDALTHARCYKAAWSLEETRDFMRRERGRQFDPGLVDAFLALHSEVDSVFAMYPD